MLLLRLARPSLLPSSRSPLHLRTFLSTPHLLSSTSTPSPDATILPRLKSDLKSAMLAKDKPRLNVIRSLLADITNASKTSKPITSDRDFLSLLKKQITSAQRAIEEFENAKREDLVEKERGQAEILEAYVKEIPVLSVEEVEALLESVVGEWEGEGRPKMGEVQKGLWRKIGSRPVDNEYVTKRVQEICG